MPTTPSWNSGSNSASAGARLARRRSVVRAGSQRLLAHAGLDLAPLAVDARRAAGPVRRRAPASSVSRHSMPSVMSASRPAALMRGPSAKPKSKVAAARRVASGGAEQRRQAGLHAAGADALEALRDQAAVVGVELHHVGHGAQRHQVEQRVELRLGAVPSKRRARAARRAAPAARRTSRRRRRCLAREAAARLVGVDDARRPPAASSARGRWWSVTSTAMPSARARGHAVDAGDAVVHRDQQVGPLLRAPARRSPASGRSRARRGRAPRSRRAWRRAARRPRRATAQAVAPSQS